MPTPFDDITLEDAKKYVDLHTDDRAYVNLAFYRGEHWDAGGQAGAADGWIGPRPLGKDAARIWQMIERAFISRNALGEVVDQHTNGILGDILHWKLTISRSLGENEQSTQEENNLIDEATAALVLWWDRMEAQEILQQLVATVLCTKRSVLRHVVPPGRRDADGNIPRGDTAQSLDKLWLQHMGTNEDTLDLQLPSATVYTDKRTREEIGIYVYTDEDRNEERAELSYLDENGDTIIRIINAGGDVEEPVILPLGGRLTIYEMTRRPLVSPQMVSQQKALNLAETMRSRNDEVGGFLERLITAAMPPGSWENDPDNPGQEKFVRDPEFRVGAGTTNFLMGVPIYDPEDKHLPEGERNIIGYTTPGVHYRDPVSPETFIRSSAAAYLNILAEAKQLHYATAGDAATSGESRKQARQAFESDLKVSAGKIEAATRWVLETALAMAAVFAGMPGRYDGLRAYVQAKVDAGPVSVEERRSARELWDADLWSKETAMSATGIEDVDAESAQIEKERQAQRSDESADISSVQSVLDSLRGGAPATNGEQVPAVVAQNGAEGA